MVSIQCVHIHVQYMYVLIYNNYYYACIMQCTSLVICFPVDNTHVSVFATDS